MSNKVNYKMQKGFTLVELAIVLVIIGLIVSSVLVGQDLIKAAQLRATVRQFNEYQVGVNTFIGKFNAVPGDLSTASSFVSTWVNGDGNGYLTDTNSATTIAAHTGEMANFWVQLSTTGKELISGTYSVTCDGTSVTCKVGTDFPAMKFGSVGWGVYGISTTGLNYFIAGYGSSTPVINTTTPVSAAFTPQEAYNIDSKIDDGIPNAGNVVGGIAHATVVTTTGAACGTTAYLFTTTTPACTMQFLMQTF